MVGIRSYGGYIPRYRLDRKKIYENIEWINPGNIGLANGEKAVANFDEDGVTMAVEASMDCIGGLKRSELGGVYFGSTTLPYQERQNAGIIAGALGMGDDVRSIDFAGSLKAGTSSLIAALESVESKRINNLVMCTSDCRLGKIGSPQEMIFGDGAAAFLISDQNVLAEFKGSFSLSLDFVDHYRGRFSKFDRQWEDRWIRDMGYDKIIPEVVTGLLKKYNLKIEEFSKIIYNCHYAAERKKLNKMLKLDEKKVQSMMMEQTGDMGAAHSLVTLVKVLEDAQPGEKILVVSSGNGGDALYFEVTENIRGAGKRKGVSWYLNNKANLDYYLKYLTWRNIISVDTGLRGEEDSTTRWSMAWRARKSILGFCGSKCTKCGTPQFPPQRICVNPNCGAIDQMEDYYFSEKVGKVLSFTGDSLAASINPPSIYGNVIFEGGGKHMLNFTDCDLKSLYVGMPVRLSFRIKRYDEKRDIVNYFWKAIPMQEVK